MKNKKFIITLLIALLLYTVNAMSMGFGFYANYYIQTGKADWEFQEERTYYADDESATNKQNADAVDMKAGAGFIFDTAVAYNWRFNYRLNLGINYFRHRYNWTDQEYHSIGQGLDVTLNNTFGFAIYRSENVRFWFGPLIGFGVGYGSDLKNSDGTKRGGTYVTNFLQGGVCLGLNIHVTRRTSLVLTGGFIVTGSLGGLSSENDEGSNSDLATSHVYGPFVNVGMIFRLASDQYN